jgi:hypothetical protein
MTTTTIFPGGTSIGEPFAASKTYETTGMTRNPVYNWFLNFGTQQQEEDYVYPGTVSEKKKLTKKEIYKMNLK